jgi:hypothetical protein
MQKITVPLAIHEGNLRKLYKRNIVGDPLKDAELDTLHDAIASARQSAEAILDARGAISADVTRTPESRALDVRRITLKKGEAAATKLDRAKARVTEARDNLAKEIAAPKMPAHLSGLATEVRHRLASMTPDARGKVLRIAFDKGDDLTIGAYLSAPAYLSGADDDSQSSFRLRWQKAKHPDALERLGKIDKALEHVERAGKSLVGMVETIANNPSGVMSERARAQADAAMREAEADATV